MVTLGGTVTLPGRLLVKSTVRALVAGPLRVSVPRNVTPPTDSATSVVGTMRVSWRGTVTVPTEAAALLFSFCSRSSKSASAVTRTRRTPAGPSRGSITCWVRERDWPGANALVKAGRTKSQSVPGTASLNRATDSDQTPLAVTIPRLVTVHATLTLRPGSQRPRRVTPVTARSGSAGLVITRGMASQLLVSLDSTCASVTSVRTVR